MTVGPSMFYKPKIIYIALGVYDYEGEDILGLFYEEKEAFIFVDEVIDKDSERCFGYDQYEIKCWNTEDQLCLTEWMRPKYVVNLYEPKIPWEIIWDVREEEDEYAGRRR